MCRFESCSLYLVLNKITCSFIVNTLSETAGSVRALYWTMMGGEDARDAGGVMRGRPRLGPCLALLIMLCLPADCALADLPRISPQGTVLLHYGESLELYCEDHSSADNIQFSSGNQTLPSVKVNDTTIKLYTKLEKGVYSIYCRNNERRKITITRVIVDQAPVDVTDFICKSFNLDVMKCWWTVAPHVSVVNFSLSFLIAGHYVESCKVFRAFPNKSGCSWDTIHSPRYRQIQKTYLFTLKSSNAFGRNEQNFTVDHYSTVQPAPVRNLSVRDIGVYSAKLSWTIPHNMLDFLDGVSHKIEYRVPTIASSWWSIDTSKLPPRNLTHVYLLEVPYAHMRYEVRVSIRPLRATGEENWSMPSTLTFYTKGKSTSEINKQIYKTWRKNMKKPARVWSRAKLWNMKSQKHLNDLWNPKKNSSTSFPQAFLPYLASVID